MDRESIALTRVTATEGETLMLDGTEIIGGTVDTLMEKLLDETITGTSDTLTFLFYVGIITYLFLDINYVATFVLTYRSFLSPFDFLKKLMR